MRLEILFTISAWFLVALSTAQEPLADDLKALQGTWRGWVVEGKGEVPDTGPVHIEIVVKGDTIVAKKLSKKEDSPLGDGTFRLALSGKTKTIDATRASSPGKGQVYLGIYSLDGNTFKWCAATPKKDRPKELVTERGQFLLILKKQ